VTSADAGRLEAAVRAEDASAVREVLRNATEADRRALAKALKPLIDGPQFELPQPVMFRDLGDGLAFMAERMAEQAAGREPEPSAHEREPRDWWQLSKTPAFAAMGVGLAGGHLAADKFLVECHGRDYQVSDAEQEAVAGVLADRNPPWLADLVERRLSARWPMGLNAWRMTRALVRLGVIDRPENPEYGAQLPIALAQEPPTRPSPHPRAVPEPAGTGGDRLARTLLADPGLLEHEVWRLFTDPGVGHAMERGILWGQLPVGDQWTDALVQLAAAGELDRDRLLDECLDAFVRDFPPNHMGWYAGLIEKLAPSAAELAVRSGRYLALLSAISKRGVTIGQQGCKALLDAGLLDPGDFLAASTPALTFPQKGVATAHLKLVAGFLTGNPAAAHDRLRDVALSTAAQAFAHQREDVQAAALKLFAKHGLPSGAAAQAAVAGLATALSPALRPEAHALGLVTGDGAAPVAAPLPGSQVTATFAAAASDVVAAVTEPAELVQLLARLMEDAADALAVERALAGAVRLSAVSLAERARLAAPLLKRARRRAEEDYRGPFSGRLIRSDMAQLTITWATGEPPLVDVPDDGAAAGNSLADAAASFAGIVSMALGAQAPFPVEELANAQATEQFEDAMSVFDQGYWEEVSRSGSAVTMAGILSARIWEACSLIAAERAVGLLAEPEFADGSISAAELDSRLARWPGDQVPAGRHDLEVARLRAGAIPADGLAFAPYVVLPKVTTGRSLWGLDDFMASRTRVLARLAGPAGDYRSHCWDLLTTTGAEVHSRHGRDAARLESVDMAGVVEAWPLLAPHHPELIAAHLLSPLSDGLDPGRTAAGAALRALASMTGPCGKVGHLALITGMASAEADVRIAGADAWLRLAAAGRLAPALAAEAMTFGVAEGALKLNRIADALRHAAAEPSAARGVADACLSAAAALLDAKPAGLHLLLELAAQAGATAGLSELPDSLTDLAASGTRSKLADGARRLQALAGRREGH
jgi:hypothetical protein